MPGTVIIGSQFGDEGKGKVTDFYADKADLVVRYQGGNNAGHTVVVGKETLKFHLLPSGVVQGKRILIGAGVVLDPRVLKEEMQKLLSWYESSQAIHPLQRAALFHGKLEKIHPFEDGNGRVGRLLINLMLLTEDYPPLIIRKTQRVSYFHALDAFDRGHADNFYYFLMEKYKDTSEKFFKIYVKYLKY